MAFATAGHAASGNAPGTSSLPGASTTPREVLEAEVKAWVGKQQGIPPAQVEIAPLDHRLNVRPCRQPLAMDLPFASAETVRVRCGEPSWQLFVRVSAAGKALSLPAATGERSAVAAKGKRRVVVAAVPLMRGTPLNESLVMLESVAAETLLPHPLEQVSQVNYFEIVRDIPQGAPIRSEDLRPLILVRRGQLVQINVGQDKGFHISAMVEAMQDGRMGEQIKLRNRESGRMLSGVVRGPNLVYGW